MPSDKVAQIEITVDTELRVQLAELQAEVARLQKIATTDTCCAYCGEAYPQGTPRFGGDALTEHIKVCPEHPMRECERHLAEAQAKAAQLEDEVAANIVLCAAEHANFEATLPMLQEEVDELSAALRGEHEHPPESELVQIAAIAINWIWQLGNVPSRDFILSESARHQYNHGYAEGMEAERERLRYVIGHTQLLNAAAGAIERTGWLLCDVGEPGVNYPAHIASKRLRELAAAIRSAEAEEAQG